MITIVKQVIVIRKDLTMRRGKEIAQACHASNKWILDKLLNSDHKFTNDEEIWFMSGQTKICVVVNSEEELLDIYDTAKKARLTTYIIKDEGRTEFNGVATNTCISIGPNKSIDIDKITGKLKLY